MKQKLFLFQKEPFKKYKYDGSPDTPHNVKSFCFDKNNQKWTLDLIT